jgi:hypothetical protein
MKPLQFSLFIMVILLQLFAVFVGLQMVCGCSAPTARGLCTAQCKDDYPAPPGRETFGVHRGEDFKGNLKCDCYQRPAR